MNLSTRGGRGRETRDGLDVARIKISLHLRRAKRGWAENREGGDRGRATGVLISALFPKGEPRQPGTRQITFPRFALYPRPILGVEVVELTARSDATLSVRMLKSHGWSQGCLKGCYRRLWTHFNMSFAVSNDSLFLRGYSSSVARYIRGVNLNIIILRKRCHLICNEIFIYRNLYIHLMCIKAI